MVLRCHVKRMLERGGSSSKETSKGIRLEGGDESRSAAGTSARGASPSPPEGGETRGGVAFPRQQAAGGLAAAKFCG